VKGGGRKNFSNRGGKGIPGALQGRNISQEIFHVVPGKRCLEKKTPSSGTRILEKRLL
jgi:hypothetical protein